eukprot:CAMPEP_0202906644 /NCGR_PEP_ID=MMETSP1392-20130828/39875_1 /ASSEMBLY_ACC=CAM_ASM_000868 /TAXON_ID=225041 /ORGANISM="Chlamydomonas chlamydogama, Strain SAG 11-48b" /LENGTH=219 /DNA_ID=CAMNT_0049595267 /DNA_START=282 /DNA_END=942 /DNA_ORIENTATION=+
MHISSTSPPKMEAWKDGQGTPRLQAYDRDIFSASPFDLVDSQMRSMERQFAEVDRQLAEMDRQIDRELSSIMGEARRVEREADEAAQRALQRSREATQQLQPGGPDVRIERREEYGLNSYRYYQSVQITSRPYTLRTAAATEAPFFSPLLLVATILTGAYAAVAVAFARNFDLTTYSASSRLPLVLLWPILAIFNKRYRDQLFAALRGERAPVPKDALE